MALKIGKRLQGSDESDSAGKAFKSTSGAKFVLFVGDEGAILVYIKGNVVQRREFIPDASEPNLRELAKNLAKDENAPVMLVVDSLDQSYSQQTLPPVSRFSVGKLIERRLEREFAVNDIKGTLLLGREQAGRKDWNFLMIAIERSAQMSAWLDFLTELPNRFQGIYLVSVEAEILVKSLDIASGVPKGEEASKWKFFVSHNKVGGFRQVILHNGRIIFTRLAQPVGEPTPEVIAGNIEQEMLSTIEYMRRLSYDGVDGLDVYIVASNAVKAIIDPAKFEAKNFHAYTPFTLAQALDIEGATQPTDQFGDVILAAAIGCSKKHVLTLSTPEMRRINRLSQSLLLQRALAGLAALCLLGYAAMTAYDMYTLYEKNYELSQKKIAQENGLAALNDEIKRTNLNIEKASDLIDLYKLLLQNRISPLPFISKLATAVKPPLLIKSIDWRLDDDKKGGNSSRPSMTAVITLLFSPNSADLSAAKKETLQDFQKAFAGYDVNYKEESKSAESQKMDINFDDPNNKKPDTDKQLTAQMIIKGAVPTETP